MDQFEQLLVRDIFPAQLGRFGGWLHLDNYWLEDMSEMVRRDKKRIPPF